MRKEYVKPVLVLEYYQLNQSIAACNAPINFGPGVEGIHETCSDWGGAFPLMRWDLSIQANSGTSFYESGVGGCDCYYTAGGEQFIQS